MDTTNAQRLQKDAECNRCHGVGALDPQSQNTLTPCPDCKGTGLQEAE